MKKININKIVALFILTLGIYSCSDDFVDVKSNAKNSEDFFKTEQDYQDALIGAYDLLQSTYLNVMLGEIASDNTLAGGESATDVVGIQEVDDMIHTPLNAQLRDIWGWMFSGVNRANYIMEFKDNIDFAGKEQVLAQTRFLRAYYYFELVKWFGDVPLIVDKRILFGEQFEIDRAPKADVYAQIEADLIYAAANLPYTQSVPGRVTKGAAQALLGKAYLFQDKFAEAATVLDNLILNGPHSLVTDYSTIFEAEGENNIESVFEVQYSEAEGAGFGCLQCSEGNVAVGFSGIRNYAATPGSAGDIFSSGFSFNVPVQEVYDAFQTGDLRRDVAILDIDAWAASTGATFGVGYEHTGYFNRKYIPRVRAINAQGDRNLTNPNNYRAIRYADVLLMAAEAFNRSTAPNDAKAQEYLNRVRARAFGNTSNNITATGATLTENIFQERRVELVGEGHRFFDLVRTGKAAQAITGFVAGKHEVFPIPEIEIQLAGDRWTQNSNY
ncbi:MULTISPECIES: RagB/SusD family nutrient uptake outer membrane protein [unclassified Polaribacter]|uniref:RagB/SusD family nutrient uptake outer membrane protein n=1 Tax=unclassified Polaribacter TaxID=196858 RepID=UPI0011BDFB86|nr:MULTISPECIES: RagB/SusD family nutrient uptake outer membrane protein [unclassified Polaribacter]TXD51927.1 RagB/SusD family nutrient uptake outer membrane protein [Polaribacter sp. IC063]TXD59729.1 RagB/SusD family nutrient uptake outer membrane protein [Polaribacter sp. IC066]